MLISILAVFLVGVSADAFYGKVIHCNHNHISSFKPSSGTSPKENSRISTS